MPAEPPSRALGTARSTVPFSLRELPNHTSLGTRPGTAREWLFDNPKIVVLERHRDAARFRPLLLDQSGHYAVRLRLCAVGAAHRVATAQLPEGHRLSFLSDCVRLERVRNSGAFLSFGAGLPEHTRAVIFMWGVGVFVVAALVAAFRRRASTKTACAAALIAAGGAGNLWDRVMTGGWVTDFMNVGVGPVRTGIFNVADLAIVAGVVLLVLSPANRARRST